MRQSSGLMILALLILGTGPAGGQPAGEQQPAGTVGQSTASKSIELSEVTQSFLQGREMERRGAYQRASEAYRRVVSASPEYIEARYRLARVLRAMDPKSTEAVNHLRFCVDRQPAQLGYRIELGNALSQAGMTAGAIEQFEALRRLAPNDPRVAYRLAELYWTQQDGDRAGRLLDDLIKRYPNQQGPATLRAQVYLKQGENQKALSLLNQALNADPTNYSAFVERSKASAAIGDPTSALRDLEQAVRANPINPEGYRLLSQARMMQGDRAGAKQAADLAETIQKIPEEQAQRLYGLYQKPQRTPAEDLELGNRLAAIGRKDLAGPFLERGLKRNRSDRAAWRLLGMIRYENGDYPGAVEAFKASGPYMKRQNRLGYYQYLSSALFNAGNTSEAYEQTKEGLRSYPKDKTLLEIQAKIRQAREPQKEPGMTAVERNRLQQLERRRRWLEEKEQKRGNRRRR